MCRLLLMTFAFLLVLFGFSGLWMMPKLIQQKIEQRLQLKIGTKTYERFTKVPIPLTVKFYIFNVSNSGQVLAGLERPQFQEVGPFVYKQWRRRDVVDFEDYNRRLRFREYKTFYPEFKPISADNGNSRQSSDIINSSPSDNNKLNDVTAGSPPTNDKHNGQQDQQHNNVGPNMGEPENKYLNPQDFNVTIVNLPLLSVLTQLAQTEEGTLKRNLVSKIVGRLIKDGNDKILITRPANQVLFDGYKVDFMESARDLLSGTLGFNFESPLPKNMFGFFFMKNGTWTKKEAGEMTIFTGRNDSMDDFMMVESWNDLKELSVWPTNTEAGNKCNEIRGSDGSQFHPGVNKNQNLEIFSPMICRSLYIKYLHDTEVRGIPLLRYTTPRELFAAPRKNPKNACFCSVPQQKQRHQLTGNQSRISDSRCYIDGLMDLTLCKKAPIAASSPHFYNADPMLAMAAGLSPNKELHETLIDVEPMTGAVMRAASRAQLNAYVEQAALDVVDSSIIGHFTPMVAPLIWIEEAAEIDEKSAREFKNQLLNLVQKARRSFMIAIAVGILLGLVTAVQYWYVTCYNVDKNSKSRKIEKANANRRPSGRDRSPARRARRDHLRENIKLVAGAQRSNMAAKLDKSQIVLTDEQATGSGISIAAKAIGAAAVLGAGATGGANCKRRERVPSDRRRSMRDSSIYDDDQGDEGERLVAAEYLPAAATNSSGSSARSLDGAENVAENDVDERTRLDQLASDAGNESEGRYVDEDF